MGFHFPMRMRGVADELGLQSKENSKKSNGAKRILCCMRAGCKSACGESKTNTTHFH